jgi:DNA repair protein RadD
MAERPEMIFVGLSATPWSAGMADHWSDLIVPTSITELIAVGKLSPFRVWAPSHPDLDGVQTVAGDYHEGQLSERMSEPTLVADVVSTWLERGHDQPTLCFAVDRAHARLLAEQFASDGVSAAYVDAYTDREERLAIAEKFKGGVVKVIVSVGTMTTGIDLDVRCLILARPTKSEILFTQIIGRALRTAPGKDFATILDHSDTHLRLGFVTDIHHAALKPGKPPSAAAKRKERQPAAPIECPACQCLIPVSTAECPGCGFVPKRACNVVCEDGELIEIGKTAKTPKPQRDPAGEVDFIRQLRRFARENDYASGWVANKFREKFGVWPNSPSLKYSGESECGPIVRSWIRSRNIAFAKATEKSCSARSDAEALAHAG